jgi:Ribosomal protein S7p/S5e.
MLILIKVKIIITIVTTIQEMKEKGKKEMAHKIMEKRTHGMEHSVDKNPLQVLIARASKL